MYLRRAYSRYQLHISKMRGVYRSWWCCAWWCSYLLTCESLYVASAAAILAADQDTRDDDYWVERARLLGSESAMMLGGALQFEDGERAANDVLMEAKESELDRGFTALDRFLPARNFLTVVDDVERSPTFRLIRQIPKGAALHVHDIALTSARWVYENVTFRDNLYVCRHDVAHESYGPITFRFLTPEQATLHSRAEANGRVIEEGEDEADVCNSTVGWELLAALRANASIAEEVNALVRSVLTIIVTDPDSTYPDTNAAWAAFLRAFDVARPLLTYRPVFADYFYQGLVEFFEDNVSYVEFRTTLPTLYDLDGTRYGPLAVARLYKNVNDRFVADHPDFFGTKLIYAPIRLVTSSQVDEYLSIAVALKAELRDFIAGFDLVGQEDSGRPLVRFVDQLRSLSPAIKFFWHAGETNWYGRDIDENLIDATLLNATRIGHGFALVKHPAVLQLARQRDIAVEVNPISNQVLGLVKDLRNHPASLLFATNYPTIVSCDDPGLWGATGLSYDFYAAFIGIMSRSADLRALKQLAINSIKYSAMTDPEKRQALDVWNRKWQIFVNDLVQGKSHT